MSLCRITAARKVGQMPGEASVSSWVSHVSVSCLSQLYCQLLFAQPMFAWATKQTEMSAHAVFLGDGGISHVSGGSTAAFYLFILPARVQPGRWCGCSRRTVLAVAAAARTPQAALHRTVRSGSATAPPAACPARKHAPRHGLAVVTEPRAFRLARLHRELHVDGKLLEVSWKRRRRRRQHCGVLDETCRSQGSEAPSLRYNQVHGALITDGAAYNELTMTSRRGVARLI